MNKMKTNLVKGLNLECNGPNIDLLITPIPLIKIEDKKLYSENIVTTVPLVIHYN